MQNEAVIASAAPVVQGTPHLRRVLGRMDLVLLFVVAVFNLNVVPSIAANGGVTVWLWIISLALFFWPQGIAVIVRGLRAVSDFEFEFMLANMGRHIAPGVETVFLTPKEHFTFISSTMVREIAMLGGSVAAFVHPLVEAAFRRKVKR